MNSVYDEKQQPFIAQPLVYMENEFQNLDRHLLTKMQSLLSQCFPHLSPAQFTWQGFSTFWLQDPSTGQVMALLTIRPEKFQNAVMSYIANVCTAAQYRRTGAMRYLLQQVLSYLKRLGWTQVMLDVWLTNSPGRKLYQSLGFFDSAYSPEYNPGIKQQDWSVRMLLR